MCEGFIYLNIYGRIIFLKFFIVSDMSRYVGRMFSMVLFSDSRVNTSQSVVIIFLASCFFGFDFYKKTIQQHA